MNNDQNKPSEEEIEHFIGIVRRQTNLSDDNIRIKLQIHDYNCIHVINEYYGIDIDINTNTNKVVSINQAIYQQLRNHMNKSKRI